MINPSLSGKELELKNNFLLITLKAVIIILKLTKTNYDRKVAFTINKQVLEAFLDIYLSYNVNNYLICRLSEVLNLHFFIMSMLFNKNYLIIVDNCFEDFIKDAKSFNSIKHCEQLLNARGYKVNFFAVVDKIIINCFEELKNNQHQEAVNKILISFEKIFGFDFLETHGDNDNYIKSKVIINNINIIKIFAFILKFFEKKIDKQDFTKVLKCIRSLQDGFRLYFTSDKNNYKGDSNQTQKLYIEKFYEFLDLILDRLMWAADEFTGLHKLNLFLIMIDEWIFTTTKEYNSLKDFKMAITVAPFFIRLLVRTNRLLWQSEKELIEDLTTYRKIYHSEHIYILFSRLSGVIDLPSSEYLLDKYFKESEVILTEPNEKVFKNFKKEVFKEIATTLKEFDNLAEFDPLFLNTSQVVNLLKLFAKLSEEFRTDNSNEISKNLTSQADEFLKSIKEQCHRQLNISVLKNLIAELSLITNASITDYLSPEFLEEIINSSQIAKKYIYIQPVEDILTQTLKSIRKVLKFEFQLNKSQIDSFLEIFFKFNLNFDEAKEEEETNEISQLEKDFNHFIETIDQFFSQEIGVKVSGKEDKNTENIASLVNKIGLLNNPKKFKLILPWDLIYKCEKSPLTLSR